METTNATPVYIKTTSDGRKVTVIGRTIYLGETPETESLVPIEKHPNRRAILQAVPGATHMAGRLPLLAEEAERVLAALDVGQKADADSERGIAERLRLASRDMLRLRIDD